MPCCSFLFAGWGNFGQRWFHIRGSSRRGWTHSRMQGPQWPSLKFVCSLSFSKPHVFNYVLLYHLWLLDSLFFSLRERVQVEQLIRYIIEEPPEDVENKRTFKLVFLTNYYFFFFFCFWWINNFIFVFQVSFHCLWNFHMWDWNDTENTSRGWGGRHWLYCIFLLYNGYGSSVSYLSWCLPFAVDVITFFVFGS